MMPKPRHSDTYVSFQPVDAVTQWSQILICCFCLKLLQQHHFDIKLPFLPFRSADVCDSVGLHVALSLTLSQHCCPPPSLHPSITRVHAARCVCCHSGLPLCTCCYFSSFCSLWFCIVSLSPVSRQWFYPMVGDIMLFYHRVEPRTGCWEVSASVSPYTLLPNIPKGERAGALGVLGSGAAAGGGGPHSL